MASYLGGLRPYLLLTLLCLALFLPGLSALPPIDRDESRFAQASHQMLESGDYVRIHFQDEDRAKKPVGVYWLQAGAAHLFQAERRIWAYRLPSLLGALAAVLLTFHFGQSLFGRPAGLMGAALLAVSFILVSEAHQAKTDAVQLACVVVAQGVLGRFYLASRGAARRPGNGVALAFWMAQGCGILVKGPIVPVISLLTLAALWIADRRIGWLRGIRPLTGLLVTAAIVAPWAVAVSSATGGQFIGTAIKTDLLPKLLGAQESHGAPPGYFLVLMTAILWPAAFFLLPGLVRALRNRQAASLRFCLAWALPTWLMFELVPTKLPHYVLPAVPALCLLAGIAVAADAAELRSRWARLWYALPALVGVALAAAVILVPLRLGDGFRATSLPAAAAALTAGLLPALLLWRGRFQAAVGAAVLGAVLTYATLFQTVLPGLDRLWLSRAVAEAIPFGTPVAAAGFHEPSLVFLLGTPTRLTTGDGAAHFLLDTPDSVAVIEDSEEAPFLAALTAAGRPPHRVDRIAGFNYSRGRPAVLTLWDLEATTP